MNSLKEGLAVLEGISMNERCLPTPSTAKESTPNLPFKRPKSSKSNYLQSSATTVSRGFGPTDSAASPFYEKSTSSFFNPSASKTPDKEVDLTKQLHIMRYLNS